MRALPSSLPCAIAERVLYPLPSLSPPLPTPTPGSGTHSTKHAGGSCKHLRKAEGPQNTLDPSCTTHDT